MNRCLRLTAAVLFAASLSTVALHAVAMPKAAEDEASPVTTGADMPKPKRAETPAAQKPTKPTKKSKAVGKKRAA